jgi:hypothetical protein
LLSLWLMKSVTCEGLYMLSISVGLLLLAAKELEGGF